eukprot:gene21012-27872_t
MLSKSAAVSTRDTRVGQSSPHGGSTPSPLPLPLPSRPFGNRRSGCHQTGVASAFLVDPVDPAEDSPASAPQCPLSQASNMLQGTIRPRPPARSAVEGDPGAVFPGPHPLSLDSFNDVRLIFSEGIHAAMLQFSIKYGPDVYKYVTHEKGILGSRIGAAIDVHKYVTHEKGILGSRIVAAIDVHKYVTHEKGILGSRIVAAKDVYKYVTHEKGILGSQGEYNSRHRKLCAPPFRNKNQLERFADIVVDCSQALVSVWMDELECRGDNGVGINTDVAEDLSNNGEEETTDKMLWAVNAFGEMLAKIFITPLPILKAMDILGFQELKTLNLAVSTMRDSMLGVIAHRRQALAEGKDTPDDLLNALLQAHDETGMPMCDKKLLEDVHDAHDETGVPMSDEELWEDVHDVMGAGHETTATTTAALLYCISVHPEVEQKVVEELDQILAIPIFPREAAAADVLPSSHPIKAGDVVFMSSYSLGRSGDIWEDPLTFNPDRFAPEKEHHRFAWLPFGAGPRMCLGANFATMSVTLMAVTLLQRFRFRATLPTTPLIPVAYDITMNFQPTDGLHMEVLPRTQPGGLKEEAVERMAELAAGVR